MKTRLFPAGTAVVAIIAVIALPSLKIKDINPKDLKGAWEQGPPENRSVMVVGDKVFAVATYDGPGKKFIASYGGTWSVQGDQLSQNIEWNSADTSKVGKSLSNSISLTKGKLTLAGTKDGWIRIDEGKPTDLTGAWIITGNFENDKVNKRGAPFYPRRTMKILSGTRFHWIAYNVKTKEFMNAGGGTYTAKNGTYIEHVDFFTKTSASVGKTLNFQYSFVDGDWRHKGQKSTGGPMDECWTRRETLDK